MNQNYFSSKDSAILLRLLNWISEAQFIFQLWDISWKRRINCYTYIISFPNIFLCHLRQMYSLWFTSDILPDCGKLANLFTSWSQWSLWIPSNLGCSMIFPLHILQMFSESWRAFTGKLILSKEKKKKEAIFAIMCAIFSYIFEGSLAEGQVM